MMPNIFVGLSSWIVQDGNYGDFRVGDAARFALEFYPTAMQAAQRNASSSFQQLHDCQYRVRGQVLFAGQSAWVMDFGAMAYIEQAPPHFAIKGSWVEGEIYLGIDPFFYFEYLHAVPGMPALQYDWRIRRILLETTPWLTTKDEAGRTVRTRDKQRESFREVTETNAWTDDEGHGHYVLECEKIG